MLLAVVDNFLKKINEPLANIGERIGGIFLILMSVIVIVQVLFRYLFNSPLDWTDETSRFLMIYMTYLALPAVYLSDKNIAMTLFLDMIKGKRFGHLLMFFIHILSIVAFVIWVKAGVTFYESGGVRADSLPVDMYVIYFIPPFMFLLTCLSALQKAISELNHFIYFEPSLKTTIGSVN